MNWAIQLYQRSPLWAQNLAMSAYGYRWKQRRYGGVFEQELYAFKNRESFSSQQFLDYQTVQLRRILVQAFQNVPYYRDKFLAMGQTESSLAKFELQDLPSLPLLSKNTLRTLGASRLCAASTEPGGKFFGSSGSTGTPVQILFSRPMHQRWSAAYEARVRHWAGLTRHEPRGMIGGRPVVPQADAQPPFYRYNRVERQVYFSAYHLSARNVANYLEGLNKHPVAYMTGYAMSNYFLARFLEESGLKAPRLKAVLPSSEALSSEMRATFQRVYGCKAYDAWSGVEACGLISECAFGHLHVSPDVAILEFLNPETGQEAAPGELAEVVCTGLLNIDQPLIRYRIGDLMRVNAGTCPCGRQMPMVQEITGRMEDTVYGPDGRAMVRFHGIFIGIPSIVEGQIVQFDHASFELNLVASRPLSAAERQLLKRRMQGQLGPVQVDIKLVDQIPRGPNGKFKAVVSKLAPNGASTQGQHYPPLS